MAQKDIADENKRDLLIGGTMGLAGLILGSIGSTFRGSDASQEQYKVDDLLTEFVLKYNGLTCRLPDEERGAAMDYLRDFQQSLQQVHGGALAFGSTMGCINSILHAYDTGQNDIPTIEYPTSG